MDLKYLTEYNKKVIEKYHKEINKLKLFNCGMSIKDRDKAIILFVLKNILEYPILLKQYEELVKVGWLSGKQFRKAYKIIVNHYDKSCSIYNEDYACISLKRLIMMNLSDNNINIDEQILDKYLKLKMPIGCGPGGIAASLIYNILKNQGNLKSQQYIGSIFNVSTGTIRTVWLKISKINNLKC